MIKRIFTPLVCAVLCWAALTAIAIRLIPTKGDPDNYDEGFRAGMWHVGANFGARIMHDKDRYVTQDGAGDHSGKWGGSQNPFGNAWSAKEFDSAGTWENGGVLPGYVVYFRGSIFYGNKFSQSKPSLYPETQTIP